MAGDSNIEWTDSTWNPTRGCSVCSPGCVHCYAMKVAGRFAGPGLAYEGLAFMHPKAGGQWTGKVRLLEDQLDTPLRWSRPRRIFVNSMSDLFHEALSIEQIAQVFAVMYLAPNHTFQVLTKRAARMRAVLTDPAFYNLVLRAAEPLRAAFPKVNVGISDPTKHPARWVHLGVSVENQKYADERLTEIELTPAAVRFVSAEPLLEETDLHLKPRSPWHASRPETWAELAWPDWVPTKLREEIQTFWDWHGGPRAWLEAHDGWGCGVPGLVYPAFGERGEFDVVATRQQETVTGRYVYAWNNIGRVVTDDGRVECVSSSPQRRAIDWVIVGGESGPGARPFEADWARSIVEECASAGVACFVKQLGANPHGGADDLPAAQAADLDRRGVQLESWESVPLKLKSRKGNNPAEWAEDLRVRQFPGVRRG